MKQFLITVAGVVVGLVLFLIIGPMLLIGAISARSKAPATPSAVVIDLDLRRPIADAKAGSEVLLCLSADSREQVDSFIARGVAAGGTADPSAKQDYGVMYGRSVADPDGHIWEIMWMDPAAAEQGAEAIDTAVPQSA